ncbi:hypothetical protein ABZ858_11725 [Streptomyces sp. NPDC047017]|uniref:DUF7144 family membrane protein n=1 Tax=Streptomyces sp. NPDC047017 TaxID=3155024 RepID=UPI0033EC8BDC
MSEPSSSAGGRDRPEPGAAPAPGTGSATARPGRNSAWVTGGVTFAGVLMVVDGVLFVLQGIAAIARDKVYVRLDNYIYRINLTGWGWIILVLGVLAVVVGCGVLAGATWARVVGILLASVSLVAQFVFLPYAPVWSLFMMALDVFVIWALAVYHPQRPRP